MMRVDDNDVRGAAAATLTATATAASAAEVVVNLVAPAEKVYRAHNLPLSLSLSPSLPPLYCHSLPLPNPLHLPPCLSLFLPPPPPPPPSLSIGLPIYLLTFILFVCLSSCLPHSLPLSFPFYFFLSFSNTTGYRASAYCLTSSSFPASVVFSRDFTRLSQQRLMKGPICNHSFTVTTHAHSSVLANVQHRNTGATCGAMVSTRGWYRFYFQTGFF